MSDQGNRTGASFDGIRGLHGREPIGAVLTIGHKGPRGNPTDTDRFFIVVPQQVDGVRENHPGFNAFNKADRAHRLQIKGNLVHSTLDGCFEHHLKAQVLPKRPQHPNKRPHCVGDGVRAERWNGNGFDQIECPNDKCQFRQSDGRGPTPCKPWMRFLFRPRWEGGSLPTPLMKFTSGSWNSTANFVGFFEHIQSQATELGLGGFSLYGLPFTLTLTKKKRSGDQGGRAFPVVQITPDGDLLEFLYNQRQRIAEIGPPPAVAALADPDQQEPEVVFGDQQTISGPVGVPGAK